MTEEERGNELTAKNRRMDYCIHGEFLRSETDKKGKAGAYWVPLLTLLRDLDPEDVKREIEMYEANVQQMRDDNWDALVAEARGEHEDEN